ncbi:MAG: 50S ribosomal protein L23 [Candidatus Gracilibacteria bacterium]|nr:50S ribosomal protein L23 [Candidatus Gracilibacteria bacterium]
MRLYDIIKKPRITEKTSIGEVKNGCFTFTVSKDSTKIDIKKAILEIYGLEVENVRVLYTREKFKQGKKGIVIRQRSTKKAYITLKDKNAKIDYTILK